ncbi:uncharacterized protein LOC121388905 [Gigantopelta aegis]|uniref:uncharacterized protein LOC121388905 n=1 Tax=Gigantopelta aegis TaxID=1735272 RepID=UPI001B8873C6|nr:uncharacterized protein LOC121388905 [Gigantopelta aegis]
MVHADSLTSLVMICMAFCLPGVAPDVKFSDLLPELATCYQRFAHVTLDRVVGRFLSWHCEAPLGMRNIRHRAKHPLHNYFNGLVQRMHDAGRGRVKRQARRCVRKEYRMLTTQERTDYHRAVNGLKRNTIVQPNVYDALAALHSEMQILKAHGGPCFLGWHRIYILMYEMALGDEVPGVCLPYWDSSLDNELEDPSQSYMFSPELMGNGNGPITTGPFAGWRRPPNTDSPNNRQPPVIRNVGADGQLYSRQSIEMILSRNDHSEIIAPNSDPDYDIEVQHGGVHLFIGGDMEALETSPFDPIFFMHHAFVDYIWELFRVKLRDQLNIDPSTNYPMDHNIQFHGRDEVIDIANFTCGDGYSDRLMETVEYESSPSCSARRPSCNSPYLRCRLDEGRCIPITLQDTPLPVPPGPGPVNPNPDPVIPDPVVPPPRPDPFNPNPVDPQPNPNVPPKASDCSHIERERHNVKPCQNTFCLNGICDIDQWVYVPVKVVTTRPPGLHKYKSFPVINGDISTANDIYHPSAYSKTKRIIEGKLGKTPKGYTNCHDDGIGQIFVQSQGLNYEGIYKESAIIDQRLATTMSIAYIAVKDPGQRGITRALFRAADSCGRVCHTSCRNPRTGAFEPCSGVIELDSQYPRMYSKNYGDATLDVWDYGGEQRCPAFNNDKFFLTFYCDYKDHLPWVDKMAAPAAKPKIMPRPAPVFNNRECRISKTCVLDVSCFSATRMCRFTGETHRCRGTCSGYAVCNYGRYKESHCSGGRAFSEKMHRCTGMACDELRPGSRVRPGSSRRTGSSGSISIKFGGSSRPSSTSSRTSFGGSSSSRSSGWNPFRPSPFRSRYPWNFGSSVFRTGFGKR